MLDLPPPLYNGLQRFVHGNYDRQRDVIREFQRGRSGTCLELGCGTGLIASFFEAGSYIGVDIDERRIALAKAKYPHHEFHTLDMASDYHELLETIDSVICHLSIHHIDDSGVRRLVDNIRRASRKKRAPIRLLLIEPVLPERALFNLPGYILAKLDRGRHVRSVAQMLDLFGADGLMTRRMKGPWFWPVPGVVMELSVS